MACVRLSFRSYFDTSEDKFQSHLNLPFRALQRYVASRARDPPVGRHSYCCGRIIKLRRIGQVETLGAIFESFFLCDVELLKERKIQFVRSRPVNHVRTAVAVLLKSWIGEGVDIEPLLNGSLVGGQVAVRNAVGA